RERTKIGAAAVGEDDAETTDVIDGLAVDDGARAGGVVADHAAEIGPAPGRHVRPELKVVLAELAVERVEHDTRLHACGAADRVDVEDVVQVLAAIEDDARPDRLARQARPAAAGRDGDAHLRGRLHGGDDVVDASRNDDAERLDLVDA